MKNVFFIVGPHGVGKTYVVSNIKKVTDVQHIDLGPLIREAHKVFAPGITFQEWIEKGEKQYGKNFTDIYNYRNSSYFIKAVEEARKNNTRDDLVIFAGACQSYYEGIMMAGANFASSPARILIDFMDPIIVAEKIAVTDEKRFVTIKDIENELRDGQRGVSGTGGNGKKKLLTI